MFNYRSVFVAIMVCSSNFSLAEDWKIDVGGGGAYQSNLFVGADASGIAIPYINAEYGPWSFGMQHGIANYRLTDIASTFQASIGIGFRDQTYDGIFMSDSALSDDEIFDGYKSGDMDITASATLSWSGVTFSIEQDISNHSQGGIYDLAYQVIDWPINQQMFVKASIGARYYDKSYVDYVYGISNENVDLSVGRFKFDGQSATNGVVSVEFVYGINQRLALVSAITAESIADEVQDSPLVDESVSYSAMVLLSYKVF